MSSKVLPLVVIFLILNAVLLYFDLTKNVTNKVLPQPLSTGQQAATTVVVPLPLDYKGVNSTSMQYNFHGRVTDIQKVGSDTKIVLDISDPKTPDFLITKDTFIINKGSDSKIPVGDIKTGADVGITMTYLLSQKTWNLTAIVIYNSK